MRAKRDANYVTAMLAESSDNDGTIVTVWADPTTHRLLTQSNAPSGNDTIGDGSTDVTTAGTAVQISSTSVTCRKLTITAKEGNAGKIWVGGSTVEEGRGTPLYQGQSITITPSDLNLVYIDADAGNDGDGVTFLYEN